MKRWSTLSVCAIGVVLSPLALSAAEQKTDIDGAWQLTRYVEGGQPDSDKACYVIVRADGIQVALKDGKALGQKLSFRVNQEASPKQILLSDPDQPDKQEAIYSYEVTGDTLKIVAWLDESKKAIDSPEVFDSTADTVLAEYMRLRSEIDGRWVVTKVVNQGVDDTDQAKYVVVRDSGIQTIYKDGELWWERFFAVDPSTTPKQIAWSDPGEPDRVATLGIYEVAGETMKLAVQADEAERVVERPKSLEATPDTFYVECRRAEGRNGP